LWRLSFRRVMQTAKTMKALAEERRPKAEIEEDQEELNHVEQAIFEATHRGNTSVEKTLRDNSVRVLSLFGYAVSPTNCGGSRYVISWE
jgi:hypothetical protein